MLYLLLPRPFPATYSSKLVSAAADGLLVFICLRYLELANLLFLPLPGTTCCTSEYASGDFSAGIIVVLLFLCSLNGMCCVPCDAFYPTIAAALLLTILGSDTFILAAC
jgi:hypothetical protein